MDLKEAARDLLAFGSIPFYFIVWIRALIGEFPLHIYGFPIAFVILILLSKIFKNANQYAARGFIITSFVAGFYQQILFSTFAFLLWFIMLASLHYLKNDWNTIIKGALLGIISAGIGYYITLLII